MAPAVFGITGWKNSGKTTLVERMVSELTRRGYRVSTVKHAHHRFDIDHPGTDSFRHRAAGAVEVALVSGYRWALMHEVADGEEPTLESFLEKLSPCDLVLIEGYKSEPHPKIEVRRQGAAKSEPMDAGQYGIVAVASDMDIADTALPVLDLNGIVEIADFIVDHCGLERRDAAQ